jgi:hypothetical protein
MSTLPATVECEVPAIASTALVGVAPDADTPTGTNEQERRETP